MATPNKKLMELNLMGKFFNFKVTNPDSKDYNIVNMVLAIILVLVIASLVILVSHPAAGTTGVAVGTMLQGLKKITNFLKK